MNQPFASRSRMLKRLRRNIAKYGDNPKVGEQITTLMELQYQPLMDRRKMQETVDELLRLTKSKRLFMECPSHSKSMAHRKYSIREIMRTIAQAQSMSSDKRVDGTAPVTDV